MVHLKQIHSESLDCILNLLPSFIFVVMLQRYINVVRIFKNNRFHSIKSIGSNLEDFKTHNATDLKVFATNISKKSGFIKSKATSNDVVGNFEYFHVENDRFNEIRRKSSVKEETVINFNKLSEYKNKSITLKTLKPSPSQAFIGIIINDFDDDDGITTQSLWIKSMKDNICFEIELSDSRINETHFLEDIEWKSDDGEDISLFLLFADTSNRTSALCITRISTSELNKNRTSGRGEKYKTISISENNIITLFNEPNEAFHLSISSSKDKRHVLLHSQSKESTAVYILSDTSTAEVNYFDDNYSKSGWLRPLIPCDQGVRSYVDHAGQRYSLITNKWNKYKNLELFSLSDEHSHLSYEFARRRWPVDEAESLSANILDYDVLRDSTVIYGRRQCQTCVDIVKESGDTIHVVDSIAKHLGTSLFEVNPRINANDFASEIQFSVTNPIIQNADCKVEISSGQFSILSMHKIKGYDIRQEFATSKDGTKVPITIVEPVPFISKLFKSRPLRPTLLIGYGAYGKPLSIAYDEVNHELLEQGWNIAFAHTRGGGELGNFWHINGKGLNKWNTFDDFSACAEYLIDSGYTEPSKLCAYGGSAGGLIMGVMANQQSALFRAIVMRSPFLDILSNMMDPSLPLTVHEYDEWGNPQDEAVKNYIMSYSPMDNISSRVYPHMFITVGMQDNRVNPQQSRDWIDKISKANTALRRQHILCPWKQGGHEGPFSESQQIQMKAYEVTFLNYAVNT